MITFENVKVEEHSTYIVLPANIAADMSWFLTRNGIKYKRLSVRDIEKGKDVEASKLFTKEKMHELIQPFVEKGADEMNPQIIVSNLNSEDLQEKAIQMVTNPRDKDLLAYERTVDAKAIDELKKEKMLCGVPVKRNP